MLSAGEQLPTVKQLALDLTVNPNTVARAYRDLERDGIIATSPGKGSFVRGDGATRTSQAAVADVTAGSLERAVREAKSMGVDRRDLRAMFRQALDRWYAQEGE